MTQEYKTLRELDVQPGDVVENNAGRREIIAYITGDGCLMEGGHTWLWNNPIWRIVSRASGAPQTYTPGERQAVAEYPCVKEADAPKLLRDMTDAEIGALVRAKNEGKVIEVLDSFNGAWVSAPVPGWWPRAAYRVRPEPKREVERVKIVNADGVVIGIGIVICEDGEPDFDSIKMEPL